MSKKTGTLFSKQTSAYPLQEVDEPNLLRDQFPYSEVPRITFDGEPVEINPPRNIWITDTTFRDGQQSRAPFTVRQIVAIFKLLNKLNGTSSLIRQSEFFLYSDKDRRAVEKCLELGFRYPEITGWIRANKKDLKLVKKMGLKETGMLTSCSDYHIFLKLKKSRKECLENYLRVVGAAIEEGIRPRCHFEDVTRADVYGFVVPFATELMKLREDSGIPVKIRLCDTMGYGVPYPEATLPRSVPKLVRALTEDAGVPSELIEWHGHNDFHKVLVNSVTCWLYGCSAVNCALLGLGERTGNCPLEGAVMDYLAMVGGNPGVNTQVITEIARYFEQQANHRISDNMPFVGQNFNMTSAGIHLDGLMKNEEIYNIFDTGAILDRPIGIVINDKSGVAGIAHWINDYLQLESRSRIPKSHPAIAEIQKWIADKYRHGRVTSISNDEMLKLAKEHLPEYFATDLNQLKEAALSTAAELVISLVKRPEMVSMDPQRQEDLMLKEIKTHPYINLMLVADTRGGKNTRFIGRKGPIKPGDEAKLDKNYTLRRWFRKPLETGEIFVSDLFKSKITRLLGMTVSAPIQNENEEDVGVLRIDLRFEDLMQAARSLEEDEDDFYELVSRGDKSPARPKNKSRKKS